MRQGHGTGGEERLNRGREIVGKKEGEQKGSARGSVHWGCYYATALDIEVDPQRCCLEFENFFFLFQPVRKVRGEAQAAEGQSTPPVDAAEEASSNIVEVENSR